MNNIILLIHHMDNMVFISHGIFFLISAYIISAITNVCSNSYLRVNLPRRASIIN